MVIDSRSRLNDAGDIEKVAYSDEDLKRFESLVKEAVGFQQNRGDSVSIINTDFISVAEEATVVPAWQNLMEEAWVWDLLKQVLGAIGLIIVYFVFGRPFLRSLNPNRVEQAKRQIDPETGEEMQGGEMATTGRGSGGAGGRGGYGSEEGGYELMDDPNGQAASIRRKNATHEQKVEMARALVLDDPARVANVMKLWVSEDK